MLRRIKHKRGFTLIEIMIAVLIVGVMSAIVGPPIARYFKRAKVTSTQQSLKTIKSALMFYNQDVGRYPSTREGLAALIPKYLDDEAALQDGWKHDFEYSSPPVKYRNKYRHYEVISYGASGEDGGSDDEADFHAGV